MTCRDLVADVREVCHVTFLDPDREATIDDVDELMMALGGRLYGLRQEIQSTGASLTHEDR